MIGPGPDGLIWLARAAEVRAMDAATIDGSGLGAAQLGMPGRVLMELAGANTAALITARTGRRPGKAVVLCGAGNNGGDGYVIARHLTDAGWTVRCLALRAPEDLTGDAAPNAALFAAMGGEIRVVGDKVTARMRNWLQHANVVVDAIFGTGLVRPVEGPAADLLTEANAASHGLKVAVDVPSGVCADNGAVLGVAFRADLTATYGLAKVGLYLHPGEAHAGEVEVVTIGLPRPVVEAVGASARLAEAAWIAAMLPDRPADGHKGTFGHVGVVGGLSGREGAAILAALGALRGGAGLVTWNRPRPEAVTVLRPTEVMAHDASDGLDPRSDVLCVGPGLGTDDDARELLALALASGRPLVLDADALNIVAGSEAPVPKESVLTPHPAEAARLLRTTTVDVQASRLDAAEALARSTGATIVLKGASTVIASPATPSVIVPISAPALATGGTGDVLAGLVAALLGQGLSPRDAAVVGVWVHARAGLRAGTDRGHQGSLASEIAAEIPSVVGSLRSGWT